MDLSISIRSFTLSLSFGSLFLRVPFVGEVFTAYGHGFTFSPWSEVRRVEAADRAKREALMADLEVTA